MTITILVPIIVLDGSYNPGDVAEIDDAIAANWIENGIAQATVVPGS